MGVDRGCPRCRECARSPLETLLRRDHRGEALLLLDSSGISAPSTLLESVNFGARASARLNLTSQCQETSGSIPRAGPPSPSARSTHSGVAITICLDTSVSASKLTAQYWLRQGS